MNYIIAERKALETLTKNSPPALDHTCKMGGEVLVYSEIKMEWLGPFDVVFARRRMSTIQNIEHAIRKT